MSTAMSQYFLIGTALALVLCNQGIAFGKDRFVAWKSAAPKISAQGLPPPRTPTAIRIVQTDGTALDYIIRYGHKVTYKEAVQACKDSNMELATFKNAKEAASVILTHRRLYCPWCNSMAWTQGAKDQPNKLHCTFASLMTGKLGGPEYCIDNHSGRITIWMDYICYEKIQKVSGAGKKTPKP